MKELNEEIKQTLNLMQSDIDDGLRDVMQCHLTYLLEIKRNNLQQLLIESSCSVPVAHDQAPYKSVKLDLQFGDPDKPLTADEYMAGGWWRADISEDALKAFIFDGDKAKPLTAEELKAGDWLCTDVSKECANALKSKNLRVFNSDEWGCDGLWVGCVMDDCGDVKRKGIFFDFVGKKQIHRISTEFYWGEE